MNDRRCETCQGRKTGVIPCLACGGSGWKPSPGDALPPLPKQPWNMPPNAPDGFGVPEVRKKPKPMHMPGPEPHFHANRLGLLEACYHRCKEINWRTLAVSMFMFTASFPAEHFLWEKAPLFSDLTHYLGL